MKGVFISCFDAFDGRIENIMDYYNKLGYACTYITSDFHHIKKQNYKIDRKDTIQIKTINYKKNLSLKRLISHYIFSKNAFKEVEKIKPDLIYVMLPPNSLSFFANKYKKKNSVKLIMDIYDLWPETFPIKKYEKKLKLPFMLWKYLRNKGLSESDLVITECDLFQEELKKNIENKKVATIYPLKINKVPNAINKFESSEINLCYLGSINNIIDIEKIISLLNVINKINKVNIHIIGTGEKLNYLIEELRNSGSEVHYYGIIYSQEEKQKIFDKCSFGLNIMKESVCIGLTLKSIDYIAGGLPLLNNIKYDTAKLIDKYKIGINIGENLEMTAKLIVELSNQEIIEMKENTLNVYKNFFSLEALNEKLRMILSE